MQLTFSGCFKIEIGLILEVFFIQTSFVGCVIVKIRPVCSLNCFNGIVFNVDGGMIMDFAVLFSIHRMTVSMF